MPKREPLTLALIEEGRFLDDANRDLAGLQDGFLAFVRRYGADAKGAKATLRLDITLNAQDPANELFGISSQSKLIQPPRPKAVSLAIVDQDEDGRECLFVRPAGSDGETPRQMKLATDNGRDIDLKTGKAKTAKRA